MSVKPPVPPPDSTAKVVKELLKQLPHADPDLKGDPTIPPAARRQQQATRQIMKSPPPGWQRSWGWVAMAMILCVGLTQWPYPRSCGFPLYGYLSVVVLLPALAVRAVVISWTDRRAIAHGFAFLMAFGGAVFVAEAVLPRVGYARSAASWSCAIAEAEATPPAPVAMPAQPAVGDSVLPQTIDSLPDSVVAAVDTVPR